MELVLLGFDLMVLHRRRFPLTAKGVQLVPGQKSLPLMLRDPQALVVSAKACAISCLLKTLGAMTSTSLVRDSL